MIGVFAFSLDFALCPVSSAGTHRYARYVPVTPGIRAPYARCHLANINAAAGDGPTEEQTAACFGMYEEFCNWGEAQLAKHGKACLAGTDGPTIADFRYIVQFSDSIYNEDPSCQLGAEMKSRVKSIVDTKP
jgi:hypothetical protein